MPNTKPGEGLDPNPYCESEPYQLRVWDQTALAGFMHCPRYHWLAQIKGLRPGGPGIEEQTSSVDLEFGSFIHQGADIYAKARGSGANCEMATLFAVEHILEVTFPDGHEPWGGQYREVWQCCDRTRTTKKERRCPWSKAEHLVEAVPGLKFGNEDTGFPRHCGVCPECGKSNFSRTAYIPTDKYKNRHTLIRSLIALCDELSASNIHPKVLPDGRIGSELRWLRELKVKSPDSQPCFWCLNRGLDENDNQCRYCKGLGWDNPYIMTGSFDGVEEVGDGEETIGKELKTTKRNTNRNYFKGLETGVQVYTYSWALNREFSEDKPNLWIVVIQVGVGFTEIYFRPVHFSKAQFEEWEGEVGFWISLAEDLARSARLREEAGQDPADAFPRNPTACMHMPGAPTTPCPFLNFCHLDPRVRKGHIKSNFHREPWNPLGTKGTEIENEDTEVS